MTAAGKLDLKQIASKWRPYPAYKPSGVEWVGEIPAHWETHLVKRHFQIDLGKMLDSSKQPEEGTSKPYLRAANIYWEGVWLDDVNEMKFTAHQMRRYRLQKGDLLVTEGGVTVGRSAIWEGELDECYYQNSLNRARLKNDLPAKLLYYWLFFLKRTGYIDLAAEKATFGHLTKEKLEALPMVVVPNAEAMAIIGFLDRKLDQIEHLTAKNERLVQLLQEQRAALISHAVTKGLDPSVPMKDSGVEWLGEIPAHWEVKAYKRVTSRIDVGIAEAATHAYADQGVPIIRSTNVKPNRIVSDDILHIADWFAEKNRSKYLHRGDIVTVRTGNAGISAVVPPSLEKSQCFTLLISTPRPRQVSQFYCYFLNAKPGQTAFSLEGWGTAQTNISVPILQNIPIVDPPYEEQKQIVSFLDRETAKIDALVAGEQEVIEKLREYRTALVSAAVTGKIDVRSEGVADA